MKRSYKKTTRELSDEGYEVCSYRCDVSNQNEAKSLIEYAVQKFGTLHILVNNAGITRDAMLHKMEKSAWEQVLQVNLTGVFLLYATSASLHETTRVWTHY